MADPNEKTSHFGVRLQSGEGVEIPFQLFLREKCVNVTMTRIAEHCDAVSYVAAIEVTFVPFVPVSGAGNQVVSRDTIDDTPAEFTFSFVTHRGEKQRASRLFNLEAQDSCDPSPVSIVIDEPSPVINFVGVAN